MKLYYISVILMTCLGTVIAQGMDGLPDCAVYIPMIETFGHCSLISSFSWDGPKIVC